MFDASDFVPTAGQYGLVIFFGFAFGVYLGLEVAVKWFAQRVTGTDVAVAGDAPQPSAPPRARKPTVVDIHDPATVANLARALILLGGICFYCFICEKMPMFPQGKRLEGSDYYWFFVFLFFVAGFLTIEHSGTNKLLHREQTNEWKGWMQYVFIAYHYCHAEYVYKPVRVFVSTYVWMTGFGNFLFFDKVSRVFPCATCRRNVRCRHSLMPSLSRCDAITVAGHRVRLRHGFRGFCAPNALISPLP